MASRRREIPGEPVGPAQHKQGVSLLTGVAQVGEVLWQWLGCSKGKRDVARFHLCVRQVGARHPFPSRVADGVGHRGGLGEVPRCLV
jgi:hypothetical protein